MAFKFGPYFFTENGINGMTDRGGVYGLARAMGNRLYPIESFNILYVGKAVNLRKRLKEHLSNPPVTGVTHFFAESIGTEADRINREYSLIQEFKPVGNTLLK